MPSFVLRRGDLMASWRFPETPLIVVEDDGKLIAEVDYFRASASAHWFMRLRDGSEARPPLPIIVLASRTPEELDGSPSLRDVALDLALDAVTSQLGR